MPYSEGVDALGIKKRFMRLIQDTGNQHEWPNYIIDWHKRNFRMVTAQQKNIQRLICNHTKTKNIENVCVCAQVESKLREMGCSPCMPKIDGHIFCMGREYEHIGKEVVHVNGGNNPIPSKSDIKFAWKQAKN